MIVDKLMDNNILNSCHRYIYQNNHNYNKFLINMRINLKSNYKPLLELSLKINFSQKIFIKLKLITLSNNIDRNRFAFPKKLLILKNIKS